MFNINNFFKLSTKEDSNHLHKGLGIVCLINYVYRYCNYIINGTMNLNNNLGVFLIITHGVLSLSSLIFHIPGIRNSLKPMIYPEFRLHSILFGSRSVIISLLYYYNFHYLYVILVCYLTMIGADMVTNNYNKDNKNGKTMRNMPFNNISEDAQKKIVKMHSYMQIGATTYMLGNIESAFSPLFAIQIAAFLMTLVRKSIITSKMWHSIYSLSLWINIFLFLTLPLGFIFLQQIMYYNYKYLFFPMRLNKYMAWTINFILFIIYKEFDIENRILYNPYTIMRIIILCVIFLNLFIEYNTLFTYKEYIEEYPSHK